MLTAYRDGRLAHAWLIGGPEGIGKATLAWRFARFLLANPDPRAPAVRDARDLSVDPKTPAARHLTALAHPDFSLVRRVWQTDKKKFYSEIRVDDVRDALQVFQMSAALPPTMNSSNNPMPLSSSKHFTHYSPQHGSYICLSSIHQILPQHMQHC